MSFNPRDKKPLRSYGIEWVVTPFSFIPNITTTTSAPLAANTVGAVSVTIAGTGLYKMTLPGGAARMVVNYDLSMPTGTKGGFILEMDGDNSSATSGVVQFRVMTAGTTTLVNFTATTGQVVQGTILQQASSYTR